MTMLGGQHRIQYGTTAIEYDLIYARRTTLAVEVYPDGSVLVKAPLASSLDTIAALVHKRAGWILRQQRQFAAYAQPVVLPRRYVSGEAYRLLGRQLRLKVKVDRVQRVELGRTVLTVYVPDVEAQRSIAKLLLAWYRTQAERIFAERLAICYPHVAAWGIAYPDLRVRLMKNRWGSCQVTGHITLNLRLVQVEPDLIDYVILHELCHLKELNHSPAFYALLAKVLPDWHTKRERLNKAEVFQI